NFPKAKPIYAYPKEMTPAGELKITAEVKETLVEELSAQTVKAGISVTHAHVDRVVRRGKNFEVILLQPNGRPAGQSLLSARRVIVALGRSGNFRKLGVPGESLDKVYNRLH